VTHASCSHDTVSGVVTSVILHPICVAASCSIWPPVMPDPILDALDDDATFAAGERVASLVTEYLAAAHAAEGPVSTSLSAAQLAARFDEPVPTRGSPLPDVLARVRDSILADANRLAHPMAMGHQVSAPLPATVWAESIIAALNQSVAVCEMSPTLSCVERRVVRWMADLAGYGADAGGTLTSGGTEATFTALLAARAAVRPDAWTDGVGAGAPVVARAVGELGLGTRSMGPNATSCASAGWAIARWTRRASTRSTSQRGRRTTARDTGGSRPPCSPAGGCCASRS
jgi:hypothetical protein